MYLNRHLNTSEEVWRTVHSHLSLCSLPCLVYFHQNFSKCLQKQQKIFILYLFSMVLNEILHFFSPNSGRYFFWYNFYPTGPWALVFHFQQLLHYILSKVCPQEKFPSFSMELTDILTSVIVLEKTMPSHGMIILVIVP